MSKKDSNQVIVDLLTMKILRGYVTAVSEEQVVPVLSVMPNLGGLSFDRSSEELVKDALQYSKEGSRVSYLVSNMVNGEKHVSFILSTPDYPVDNEDALLDEDGVLAYVYNVAYPLDSEMGYIFLEKQGDGYIHRIG